MDDGEIGGRSSKLSTSLSPFEEAANPIERIDVKDSGADPMSVDGDDDALHPQTQGPPNSDETSGEQIGVPSGPGTDIVIANAELPAERERTKRTMPEMDNDMMYRYQCDKTRVICKAPGCDSHWKRKDLGELLRHWKAEHPKQGKMYVKWFSYVRTRVAQAREVRIAAEKTEDRKVKASILHDSESEEDVGAEEYGGFADNPDRLTGSKTDDEIVRGHRRKCSVSHLHGKTPTRPVVDDLQGPRRGSRVGSDSASGRLNRKHSQMGVECDPAEQRCVRERDEAVRTAAFLGHQLYQAQERIRQLESSGSGRLNATPSQVQASTLRPSSLIGFMQSQQSLDVGPGYPSTSFGQTAPNFMDPFVPRQRSTRVQNQPGMSQFIAGRRALISTSNTRNPSILGNRRRTTSPQFQGEDDSISALPTGPMGKPQPKKQKGSPDGAQDRPNSEE